MKKTVIIAAAGKGNRLGAGTPKCLVEVNGHAIFEYLLKAFVWADEICMVVGYKSEEVISKVVKIAPDVRFVTNKDFETTTTLQSNYLGANNIEGMALFIDGDMIISKETARELHREYQNATEFAGVASDISEEPVYAGVRHGEIEWFDYHRMSDYEWANVALLDTKKLEYLPTHFFGQIEKFLPLKAVKIERLEIDTPSDFEHAEAAVSAFPEKYDYWRKDI